MIILQKGNNNILKNSLIKMFWKHHNFFTPCCVHFILREDHCVALFQLSNCVQGVVVVQNDTTQSGFDPSLSAPIIRHDKVG